MNKTLFLYNSLLALCVFFSVITMNLKAQTGHFTDTIPYNIVMGKMIISVKIDNKPTRLIFDTGGRNFLVRDSAIYHNLAVNSKEIVSDVNSLSNNLPKGTVRNLQIGNHFVSPSSSMLVMPNNPFFEELGVAGALGGEAFAEFAVTFHSREKYITLSYPYRPKGISRKDGMIMNTGNNFHSIISVGIGNNSFDALFDTGMGGFLHITLNDYRKLKAKEHITEIAKGAGIYYVGIGGLSNAKQEEVLKLDISDFRIGNKHFSQVGSLAQNRQISIVGLELLNYGNVMLDYPRGLFYFFPFDNTISDMNGQGKVWNVRVLPTVTHFEVTATIDNVDIQIGEQVWNINGVNLEGAEKSETFINSIFDSIKEDTAYLIVGKDKKDLRKVIIKKI